MVRSYDDHMEQVRQGKEEWIFQEAADALHRELEYQILRREMILALIRENKGKE